MFSYSKVDLLTAAMMSCAMGAFFSGFYTFLNFGFSLAWVSAWGLGFVKGWPLAATLALLLGKPIRKLAVWMAGTPGR